jgi:hypothetical protein
VQDGSAAGGGSTEGGGSTAFTLPTLPDVAGQVPSGQAPSGPVGLPDVPVQGGGQ